MLINAYSTVRVLPELSFPHQLRARRGLDDPELLTHLQGFIGFVASQAESPLSIGPYHVQRHLRRVRHHVAFEIAEADFAAATAWGQAANAVFFFTDSTVRDPAGRRLIGSLDEGEEPGTVPYPPDAVRRLQRVCDELEELGVETRSSLPPVVGEAEAALRTPDEVVRRVLAVYAVAVLAETIATHDPLEKQVIEDRLPSAAAALSPDELEFWNDPDPAHQTAVNFTWRYEALWVLEWALGLVDELPFPSAICDVPACAQVVLGPGEAGLFSGARLRPVTEILDALERCVRLHWVATESQLRDVEAPLGLMSGVLQQRHHALNWLCGFEGADWDDVDTST